VRQRIGADLSLGDLRGFRIARLDIQHENCGGTGTLGAMPGESHQKAQIINVFTLSPS